MLEVSAQEAMILAVDSLKWPTIEDGQIKPSWPLCVPITIYIDYHVSDGAEVDFLKK